jgi:hypothetical protein
VGSSSVLLSDGLKRKNSVAEKYGDLGGVGHKPLEIKEIYAPL